MKKQSPGRVRHAEGRAEHRTIVLLRASQRQKLSHAAQAQGVSMAEVIRQAVDNLDLAHRPFPTEDASTLAKDTIKLLASSARQVDAARRELAEIRSRLSTYKGDERVSRSRKRAHGPG